MKIFGIEFHPRNVWKETVFQMTRFLSLPLVFAFCRFHRVPFRFDTRFLGLPCVWNRGSLVIGKRLTLCSRTSGNSIGVSQRVRITIRKGARLTIGDQVGISGSSIYCARAIAIGNRVRIGSGCLIMDNDAHALDPVKRNQGAPGRSAPVRIADDAFIGARSIILKGVSIGEAAVVGAGSVVTKNVPPRTIVAGNPARAIGVVPPS